MELIYLLNWNFGLEYDLNLVGEVVFSFCLLQLESRIVESLLTNHLEITIKLLMLLEFLMKTLSINKTVKNKYNKRKISVPGSLVPGGQIFLDSGSLATCDGGKSLLVDPHPI